MTRSEIENALRLGPRPSLNGADLRRLDLSGLL